MKRRLTFLPVAACCVLTVGCSGKSSDGTGRQNEAVVIRSESLGIDSEAQTDSTKDAEERTVGHHDSTEQDIAVNEICDMLSQVKVYEREGNDTLIHHLEPQSIQLNSPDEAHALVTVFYNDSKELSDTESKPDTLTIIREDGKWVIDDINHRKERLRQQQR